MMDVRVSLEESITRYWGLNQDATSFLERLVRECETVGFVLHQDKVIGLLYILRVIYKRETVEVAWFGALPASEVDIQNRETQLGVRLPNVYRDFIKTHNGFWLNGWNTCGIYTLNKVGWLKDISPPDSAFSPHNPSLYLAPLLCISGDGGGNETCFGYQSLPIVESGNVAVWDHESHIVSSPLPFWDYLSRLLAWVG